MSTVSRVKVAGVRLRWQAAGPCLGRGGTCSLSVAVGRDAGIRRLL